MGYLPSFRPTEIFVTPRQEGVFGISQDSFLPFANPLQQTIGGFTQTTIGNPLQQTIGGFTQMGTSSPFSQVQVGTKGGSNQIGNSRSGSGIQTGNQVGVNPDDNGSSVNPPPPSTPPTNMCPTTYFPVCANGQTFPNACEAQNAGFMQYTQGECATNGGGNNGNGGGGNNGNGGGGNNGNGGGGNQPIYDPETGCIIQGFDNLGNPIYIDQNGNPSLTTDGCQIHPNYSGGVVGPNGGGSDNGGGGGGGGTIPDDEKIIAFVKKNWMYLLAVTAGIYLLTNKSN